MSSGTPSEPLVRGRVTRERSNHGPGGWLIRVDGKAVLWRRYATEAEAEMARLREELRDQ